MLVPLDPKNDYKPVAKRHREKWIEREAGFAGRPYDAAAANKAAAERTPKPQPEK